MCGSLGDGTRVDSFLLGAVLLLLQPRRFSVADAVGGSDLISD